MIEVNLYAIPTDMNNARVGKCLARNRFDKEAMGISVEEFVKGFLKDNLDKFENGIGNSNLVELINTAETLTRQDLACINFYLIKAGFMFQIQNVTDDEENPVGVPSGDIIEWNIINTNFVQNDYPTATKLIPAADQDILYVLKQVVSQSNVFSEGKFAGIKNPFTDLFVSLDRIKNVSGSLDSGLISRIYEYLDQVGIQIFCATSED